MKKINILTIIGIITTCFGLIWTVGEPLFNFIQKHCTEHMGNIIILIAVLIVQNTKYIKNAQLWLQSIVGLLGSIAIGYLCRKYLDPFIVYNVNRSAVFTLAFCLWSWFWAKTYDNIFLKGTTVLSLFVLSLLDFQNIMHPSLCVVIIAFIGNFLSTYYKSVIGEYALIFTSLGSFIGYTSTIYLSSKSRIIDNFYHIYYVFRMDTFNYMWIYFAIVVFACGLISKEKWIYRMACIMLPFFILVQLFEFDPSSEMVLLTGLILIVCGYVLQLILKKNKNINIMVKKNKNINIMVKKNN